jgi:hypothetical protein
LLDDTERADRATSRDEPLTAVQHHQHQHNAVNQLVGLGEVERLQRSNPGCVAERVCPLAEPAQHETLKESQE